MHSSATTLHRQMDMNFTFCLPEAKNDCSSLPWGLAQAVLSSKGSVEGMKDQPFEFDFPGYQAFGDVF